MTDNSDRFTVRFWGVRGSIPVPGPETERYGGNTTCVQVRCGNTMFVIDAGSGIRELGRHLAKQSEAVRCHILMTHLHWDHIQGFPYFRPAFDPSSHLTVWSENDPARPVRNTLSLQMSPPMFPIRLEDMEATLDFRTFELTDTIELGGARITMAPLNHPGGATAYRIDYAGHSYVHASDHEHTAELYKPLVDLASGADYLVYDAAYTDNEYTGRGVVEPKKGYGHSTWKEAIRTATAADVAELILFQHQYDRTDEQLDQIGRWAKQVRSNTVVAFEGMELDLLAD